MTLSSKLILLAIACMYFSLTQKLKTLHIGCLHLFVQFSKVYFVVLTTSKVYHIKLCLSNIFKTFFKPLIKDVFLNQALCYSII